MNKTKLFVGNINYSITNEQLKELFSTYGDVKSVNIIKGKGFGFIEMADSSEAGRAMLVLDGFNFKGRKLRVVDARPSRRDYRKY